MKQVENQYPMLLIPQELISIIEDNENKIIDGIVSIKIGDIPVKPTSPKIIAKPYPPYLSSSNLDSAKFNLYFLIGISAFVVICLTINDFSEISVFFSSVIYSIPTLVFLFRAISKYSDYVEDKNKYKIDYQKHIIDLQNYKKLLDDYNLKKTDYETKLELYNIQLAEYENKKAELIISKEFNTIFNKTRKEYINNLIKEFSQEIIKPQKSEMDFTIGISESYFLKYLNKYFKDIKILKHYILGYYEPDFTLILENGLHIDIEIDEPYSGNTKEIIHYYDILKKEFSDNSRNKYFLSNGWVVIRFSEQQIIEQPDSCCKFIAKILHFFNHNIDIEIFNEINEITPMNIWSKKEANEMAYFDYRKKYLNEDIIKKTLVHDKNINI